MRNLLSYSQVVTLIMKSSPLCVRWYVTYKFSYRDLAEMRTERHVEVAHTTIMRWGANDTFPKSSSAGSPSLGGWARSWHVNETYIKIRVNWGYLYRAVDKDGQTVDVFLSERRDVAAAKRCL